MNETRTDATNFVITCLDGGQDYPIDKIVDALYEIDYSWNFDEIDELDFWATVAAVTERN